MRQPIPTFALLALSLLAACTPPPAVTAPAARPQADSPDREEDEYSRYELLEPGSAQFHILFEVTATEPGATVYFNPIRKGSAASGESVRDQATGQPLSFEEVTGEEARASGLPDADLSMSYIRIHLPRPVPQEGGIRLLIEKTYKDPQSYTTKDDRIVFQRTLGIRRNSIVLPAGYELTACNAPAQVLPGPDGRLAVSFMHPGPDAFPLVIEARRTGQSPTPSPEADEMLTERAHQDREIVYFLQQPETHAFDLYHDYTETKPGVDRYLNVVRAGSTASNTAARNLDTGEALQVETVKGHMIPKTLTPADVAVPTDADVVVAHFAPVPPGGSVRLRISETYTDPKSYRLEGDELVFDRTLGRPRNAVVLPAGWLLTASSIPAQVSETADGRIRLDFINPRPDQIEVLIKARRR